MVSIWRGGGGPIAIYVWKDFEGNVGEQEQGMGDAGLECWCFEVFCLGVWGEEGIGGRVG